jgi:hypothetical protein
MVAGGTATSLASRTFEVIVERESCTTPSVVSQHPVTATAYCESSLA